MAELATRTLTGTAACDPIVLNTPPRTILLLGIPAGWTESAILVEQKLGSVWGPLKEQDGSEVRIVATAGDMVRLDPCLFQHAREVRFKSEVSQGAARTVSIQIARLAELINGTGA